MTPPTRWASRAGFDGIHFAVGDVASRKVGRRIGTTAWATADAYFAGSMRHAKLPAMRCNAAVVLGDVGTEEDVDVLTRALDDEEPEVREHAAWALLRLHAHDSMAR